MGELRPFEVTVVGAGTAGCVVASRLAAAGVGSVLLLEAGPDLRRDVPHDLQSGWRLGRPPDWGYASELADGREPQKLRRGRLVGGTSWLTRFAVRGSPADFDGWAAAGNAGWAFDDVLQYFRRLEFDVDFGDRAWHGDAGPIPVNRYLDLDLTEVHAAAVLAAEAAGFRRIDDHNEPGALGVGRMPMNSVDAVRVTAAAYLDLARDARNLVVRADAPVDKVVVDGGRATGVRLTDGTLIQSDSVVVTAGTYGSPQVLLRSGIGPAADIRAAGIEVQGDLPGVGANLRDHPAVEVDTGYDGPARDVPLLHSIATFHSRSAPATGPHDLMLWVSDPGGPDSPPQLTIEAVLLRPDARGNIRLRSADPTQPPRIALPVPTDGDVDRLVEAVERAVEVAGHPGLRRLCRRAPHAIPSGRGELRDQLRESVYSIPHVVGTCAMGPRAEDGAVVDANGRVHGVQGLFVADASIIPEPPSGFSHLPTLMVAERLSEVIAEAVAGVA